MTDATSGHNRLGSESSPYLRQHADNPVHWWPWSDAAFAEARERGVPVLLSIGYSTCHWCHVMAHESFENEQTAELMNQNFVNIKVDREERPDVDGIYMAATQAMTGAGGWPMTVFLNHDRQPFHAGTYYPPHEGMGMPSFHRIMGAVTDAWQHRRADLDANAQALTEHIQAMSEPRRAAQEWPSDFLELPLEILPQVFDRQWGGFGGAPKFPAPTTLDFLLQSGDAGGQEMALHTLRQMLRGGIYDQLGGGFHRYSVDERWLVPHFEKMLYDNAQLTRTLLAAYQVSGDQTFADAARETLTYLEREMRHLAGGFHSAQDADTAGVEGLTFTWTPAEVEAVLGEDAAWVAEHYGVNERGNFEDPHRRDAGRRTVLSQVGKLSAEQMERLPELRRRLLTAREQRQQPHRDDKVLTSWNGLVLAALADAGRILGERHWLDLAQQNAAWVRGTMRQPDGTLWHTWLDGQAPGVEGLLEDHALYGLGLVALYQATGDLSYLEWARELWDTVQRDFWDEDAGLFRSSGGRAERLLTRQSSAFDSAIISDNAAAALLGLWMDRYYGLPDAAELSRRTIAAHISEMGQAPHGMGGLWQAAALLEAPHTELAIIGTPAERDALERVAAKVLLSYVTLAPANAPAGLPVLEGREGGGTAYLCVNRACRLPVRDAEALREQLEALTANR
ncbi:thioredoxin domain-containing protein [Deinococcus radiophilus]|uniref:Thioredoxin domain-containing protein n=1 Tax=Deinococcus radiophilus TaxID=32062 RepID=A0A3S0LAG7_9DEIO|nr:thioredoxin domain-containing protein [Deinococcus radiophilus]RTR30755.1 thioredoxin domain-containing protein [Deinococcus radiophilus]UFA51308.1 thioredoxin domain-containing protein [Deinococcus radiophilus]